MTDQPKLRAFITTVTFAGGEIHTNAMVAPDQMAALTVAAIEAGRRFSGDSVGYACVELLPEFMRAALRAMESGKPSGAVVSLVSDNLRPPQPTGAEADKIEAEFRMQQGETFAEAVRQQHPEGFDPAHHLGPPPVPQGKPTWPERRCPTHFHAPLLNGRCSICEPTGGAA